jgi:hypothetical protein
MIKIKDIVWKESVSSMSEDIYHDAYVRDYKLLSIIPFSPGNFYIHTSFPTFKIKGNKGIEVWGFFDNLDMCKTKAEEIITEEILSFMDLRDYKINQILK